MLMINFKNYFCMKQLSTNYNLKLLILIFFIFTFSNCEKEQNPQTQPIQNLAEEGMIKLGKKLENPFTVENIRKAYSNLVKQGSMKAGLEITATHQYVRLLPSDMEAFDMLELDTLNVMFDYPLDYEVIEGGTYYYDPDLDPSENPVTWQYMVIPIDKPLPTTVKTEKLADLVLDISALEKSPTRAAEMWDRIESEALRITGNLSKEENTTKSRWRPAGRITVWDDIQNSQIPLQGAKVIARWWFFWEKGFTDANGYYSVSGTFKGDRAVNYSIIWERDNWDIREEEWGQAYYNGPKKTGDWNLDINSGKSLRYATIHRAALIYYYGNSVGIQTPPQDAWYKRRLKIGYYHRSANENINGDANPYWPQWYTWPDIRIFGENSNGWRNTRDIFATSIHELAHASHWDLVGKLDFINTSTIVAESWARGVQWAITRNSYAGYRPPYSFGSYTGVVEDLVDGLGGTGSYDQVSGYTMYQIEQALKGAKTWTEWKNNIKNKYDNATENQLDNLFTYWQ